MGPLEEVMHVKTRRSTTSRVGAPSSSHSPRKICTRFGSAGGCRFGKQCWNSHDNPLSVRLCSFFFSARGCHYGNKCYDRHKKWFALQNSNKGEEMRMRAMPSRTKRNRADQCESEQHSPKQNKTTVKKKCETVQSRKARTNKRAAAAVSMQHNRVQSSPEKCESERHSPKPSKSATKKKCDAVQSREVVVSTNKPNKILELKKKLLLIKKEKEVSRMQIQKCKRIEPKEHKKEITQAKQADVSDVRDIFSDVTHTIPKHAVLYSSHMWSCNIDDEESNQSWDTHFQLHYVWWLANVWWLRSRLSV